MLVPLVVLALLVEAGDASGQEAIQDAGRAEGVPVSAGGSVLPGPESKGVPDPFRRGAMILQVQGAGYREAWGFNGHVETLAGAAVAFGYFFLDRLSINAEVLLLGARQEGWDTFLGGSAFYPRWHFFRRGPCSLYLDAGVGVSLASRRLPEPVGTEFNFLILAGPGMTFRVSDSCLLTGCFRYLHLSNGSIAGTDRNPDIDSLGGQAGVLFPF